MVPERQIALNWIRRTSIVAGSTRGMSTGAAQVDGKILQGSKPLSDSNRTWKSSQSITFTSPKNTTWGPQHGLRFSSSSTPSIDPRMPVLDNAARHSIGDGTTFVPTPSKDSIDQITLLHSPAYPELSSSRSSPGLSTHDDPFYPLLDIASLAQAVPTSDSEGQSQSPTENDEPRTSAASNDEPFRSPLGFHIPKAIFQNAMNATPPSPSAYWQHTLYRGPGSDKETVKVHYCKNKENTETIAQLFLEEEVIGFDLEWKINPKDDSIKKNVALVQVASERRVALFHLARFPNAQAEEDFITPSFRKLMESPEITKVGVNVKGDSTRLRNFLHIECQGLFELSHLHKLVKFSSGDVKNINKKLVSLASQVQEHLQLPLWKGEVRSSDWSQELSYRQTQYAASDSYAGFQLFHMLENKRKAMNPTPPRPAHAELNLPIRQANGQDVALVDETAETHEDSDEDSDQCCEISVEDLTSDIDTLNLGDPPVSDSEASLVPNAPPVAPSSVRSPGEASGEKSVSLPPSRELDSAIAWVQGYCQNTKPSAKPAELRAYALWQEQGFDIPTVAKLLRVPPLQNTTVVNYIGKAISNEMLPYQCARVAELEQYAGPYGLPVAFRNFPKRIRGEDGR